MPKNRPYEVLVVAAQRSTLQQYLDGFKRLRLNCTHMDVAPCALASLIEKLMPEQETMVGVVVLGAGLGYFAVVERQRVLFWRPFELPEKRQQAGLERVGDEISKCVSHMVGSLQFDGMMEILIFGENAQDSGFSNYLTTRFNLQVRSPSPFETLPADGMPAGLRSRCSRRRRRIMRRRWVWRSNRSEVPMAELIPLEYRIEIVRKRLIERWMIVGVLAAAVATAGLATAFAWQRERAQELAAEKVKLEKVSDLIKDARNIESNAPGAGRADAEAPGAAG